MLYIQPQVQLPGEIIIGGEVLVRWNHPVLGMVYPDTFIPVAETMDIKVVAEGVENSDQLEILKERKNIVVQGYYYSKPMPLELFENYIQNKQK